MSYTLTMYCGCRVVVECDGLTGLANSRVIGARGTHCPVEAHTAGTVLRLWELLPPSSREVLGRSTGAWSNSLTEW